jgi:centrosomal CEP192-like protein/parallel beta helix pectate lyase-like protein
MKKYLLTLSLLMAMVLGLLPLGKAGAATFNVTNAAELQAALTNAQNNGEDDTINLQAGEYDTADNTPADTPFVYTADAAENKQLTLIGAGIGSTILKENAGGTTILQIIISSATDESQAGVTVQNLSIKTPDTLTGLLSIVGEGFIVVDTVEFSQVGNSSNTLISSAGGPITVQNSTVMGSTSSGLLISGTNSLVTLVKNEVTKNGIGLNVVGSNPTVDANNNTFSSNTTFGILISSGTGNVSFEQNTVEDHELFGAQISTSDGDVNVNANTLGKNHGLNALGVETGTGQIILTNNLIFGNDTPGGGAGASLTTDTGLVTVTNNTVFDNFSTSSGGGILINLNAAGSETKLFNNIFFENVNLGSAPGDDFFVNDDTDTGSTTNNGAPVTVSNNILFDFSTACLETPTDCNNAPNVTETATTMKDPLFVDGPNANFNLLPGSPAIGAGDAAAPSFPTQDFAGHPMNNPPDLGALQATAGILVDPAAINFGKVSTDVPNTQTITVQNTGGLDLDVTDVVLSNTTNFSLDFNGGSNPCGSAAFTLAAGDSCTINVIFKPQSDGTVTATMTISSNDPTNPSIAIPLNGVGVSAGGCGCHIGEGSPPNLAWFLAFLALLPLAGLRLSCKR